MEVKWLVENYEQDFSLKPMMDEIKKQGMQLEVCSYKPWESGVFNQYSDEDCVIFYGTLNLARQLQREKGWVPGVYCNFTNMCCKTYYSYWGKYLFNQDYIMLPMLEIKRKREEIFKQFGVDDTIFIRPDSGAKPFTGQTLPLEFLDKDIDLFGDYAGKPIDEIITIISSPKVINKEWRIVVVDGEPVSASLYRSNGEEDTKKGCEVDAWLLAARIAKESWQPDKAYTLDICKSNGEYFMLEVNSFSCSGLYKCHPEPIIKSVSEAALKEWKEYNS